MPTTTRRRSATRFTVPEVWRTIVKKNERHGKGLFDVLVCAHAVPANDNTYRRARACPACRERAQEYADEWQRAASAAASADVAEGAA